MLHPMYQKAMMGLSIEFLVHIKEEKDPKLYKQFIEKVVQHISALDTSVRDVKADDVLVTIKDSSCKFVTGVDEEESDDDVEDTISPYDVINTFQVREVTRETRKAISRCFRHMSEVHESMWEAFIEAGELTHILPKRGLALLLEAMATGSVTVQDTKAYNVLVEAKIHRKVHKEVKSEGNKRAAFDLKIQWRKDKMLPNWKNQVFNDTKRGVNIGKIVVAVSVYLGFAMGEGHHEVPLTIVGEQFRIGQRNTRKVATGRLYKSEGESGECLHRNKEGISRRSNRLGQRGERC